MSRHVSRLERERYGGRRELEHEAYGGVRGVSVTAGELELERHGRLADVELECYGTPHELEAESDRGRLTRRRSSTTTREG